MKLKNIITRSLGIAGLAALISCGCEEISSNDKNNQEVGSSTNIVLGTATNGYIEQIYFVEHLDGEQGVYTNYVPIETIRTNSPPDNSGDNTNTNGPPFEETPNW